MVKVLLSFGTRPEAIKLAPVIKALQARPQQFQPRVVVTAQHRGMLDQVLDVFDIVPDHDLNVMKPGQTLADVTVGVLQGLEAVLAVESPDIVLVQGDTTSAFVSALAAYYQRVAVGHVEAGLRTEDKFSPYPEEMNRRLVGVLADIHFPPTERARQNLLGEGVPADRIHVTGNTVIDALHLALASDKPWSVPVLEQLNQASRIVLVTAHRRESFGPGFQRICQALAQIVDRNPEVEMIYPVHLNPNVREPVMSALDGRDRIHLIEPLEYLPFVRLMEHSYIILTDSGGIQEEAPGLGKPVLVMRDKTERPEAIEAGTARLVGTDVDRIVTQTEMLLRDPDEYSRMAKATNPFGDGKAAVRVCEGILGLTLTPTPVFDTSNRTPRLGA